jgi:uncharacterized protein YdeI (YjbR/CyaY-like superfamily)
MSLPDLPHLEIAKPDHLWDWLAANPAAGSHLLVTWKAADRGRYVSRDQVLDALIAHGWIDGRRYTHEDPARTIQLIAPRGQKVWAESYKSRAARLEAEGRMQPAGLEAIAQAKAAGLWHVSEPIDALEVPADLRSALDAANASTWFDASAPSYRRNVLRFLAAAKRSETRAKRLGLISAHAARGEKLPQY